MDPPVGPLPKQNPEVDTKTGNFNQKTSLKKTQNNIKFVVIFFLRLKSLLTI